MWGVIFRQWLEGAYKACPNRVDSDSKFGASQQIPVCAIVFRLDVTRRSGPEGFKRCIYTHTNQTKAAPLRSLACADWKMKSK